MLALQQSISTQEAELDKLLGRTASTGSGSGGASSGSGTSGSSATGSGSSGSTTVAVSAAQLAADQAAVDAANAELAVAQQQLQQATIVSPFAGVVSSVGLTVGQAESAGSTTQAIDVIDPNGHGVSLSVDVTKVPMVKVGQKATVVPDGTTKPLAATVSYVAPAPASSSSTAYAVQLTFDQEPAGLRDGIPAAVTLTTQQAENVLAVPTSAVSHLGPLSFVTLLDGSTTKRQLITAGAVGAIYTQVTKGLTAGQLVVLADPSQAIPTSTITGRVARITGGAGATTGLGGLGGAGGLGTTGGFGGTGARAGG